MQIPFYISYKLPDFIPNLNIDLNSPVIKRKIPPTKKDTVLDTPEEIKKWLDERRKRYPSINKKSESEDQGDLSILEQKLRKKISILSGSCRRTQIKTQQMRELCKTITAGKQIRKKRQQENQEPTIIETINEQSNDEVEDDKQDNKQQQITNQIKILENQLKANRPKEYYKQVSENNNSSGKRLSKQDIQMKKAQIKQLKKELLKQDSNYKEKEETLEQEKDQKKEQQANISNEQHAQEMIENLEEQREKMADLLEQSLTYKANSANYRYKSNTLYANLIIDDIYKERQYLLQAFRFLVKEQFFDKQETQFEQITSESSQSSSSESEELQEDIEDSQSLF